MKIRKENNKKLSPLLVILTRGHFQFFSGFSILCLVGRDSSITGGFYLDRSVPFLVNTPDLSRNLLRAAMPCLVSKIFRIYIKLRYCGEFESSSQISDICG